MRLGIGSYTYSWAIGVPGFPVPEKPYDAVSLLNKAAELGVEVVQICDNLPLHRLDKSELDQLAATARRLGLKIEAGTRGIESGHLHKYLEIARRLDACLLRTMVSPGDASGIEEAAQQIAQVLPDFARAGIPIALENYEQIKTGDLARLVKRVDSSFLGVCLDTVNSFGALECPEKVIAELAPFVINLHVKDFTIQRVQHKMGFVISGCAAGEGLLDVDRLIGILRHEGREPSVILELWTPFNGSIESTIALEGEWADRSIRYLKEKINI